VVSDNAGQQRGKAIGVLHERHHRLEILPFAPYRREQNPDGDIWLWIKSKWLAIVCASEDGDFLRGPRGAELSRGELLGPCGRG